MTTDEEQGLNKRFANALYEIYRLDGEQRTAEVIRTVWEKLVVQDRVEFVESLEKYVGVRRLIKGVDQA